MIKLENCSKTYNPKKPNELLVLDDINLHIKEGEMIAIMGKSGSDKTTLLNLLGLLDTPSDGYIYFKGEELSTQSEAKRSKYRANHIGIVLQNFALLLDETVKTNVLLSTYFGNKKKSEMLNYDEVINNTGLVELENKKVNTLSGRQMQRVAIARALLTNPDIILADEPTGSLDEKSSDEIMALLTELNRMGKTILVVTYDKDIAAFCNRTIHIVDGKIEMEAHQRTFKL